MKNNIKVTVLCVLGFLYSIESFTQTNTFLVDMQFKEHHESINIYFYIEPHQGINNNINNCHIIDLLQKTYTINYLRLFDFTCDNHIKCCQGKEYIDSLYENNNYLDRDTLCAYYWSIDDSIRDLQRRFNKIQITIPIKKLKKHYQLTINVYKMQMKYCICYINPNDISSVSNKLIMPNQYPIFFHIHEVEYQRLKQQFQNFINIPYVRSTLPKYIFK